jgi:hypothetical protein
LEWLVLEHDKRTRAKEPAKRWEGPRPAIFPHRPALCRIDRFEELEWRKPPPNRPGYFAYWIRRLQLADELPSALASRLVRTAIREQPPASRVDLLVTVAPCRARKDPAGRDPAAETDATTPVEAVREHANHYQKNDLDHPGAFLAIADSNQRWSPHPAGAHDRLPIQTLPVIKKMLVYLLR